jgi:excisionase family DNA binding protein
VGKPAAEPEVMTTPEACRFLRIDKRTYYALVESGQIQARKLGRGYKVLKKKLIEFMESRPSEGRQRRKRKKR